MITLMEEERQLKDLSPDSHVRTVPQHFEKASRT